MGTNTKKMTGISAMVFILSWAAVIGMPGSSCAMDVILDGKAALNWLRNNDYIDRNNVPLPNFYEFRSRVIGGGAGPGGLKAIMAEGWNFRGPLNDPIKEPVVIVVPQISLQKPIPFARTWNWTAICQSNTWTGTFTISTLTPAGKIKGTFGGGHWGELDGSITGKAIKFRRIKIDANPKRFQNWQGTITGNTISGSLTDSVAHPSCTFTAR
jgi:hypothetical protein